MKKLILGLLIATALVGCHSETDPCSEFDAIDLEMNNMIEEIRRVHSDKKMFLYWFNLEQVYWIQYRDNHLRTIYPNDWDRHYREEYGKELFNPCKCKEMTRYTKDRIKELKYWFDNPPKGQDECPTLWNESK